MNPQSTASRSIRKLAKLLPLTLLGAVACGGAPGGEDTSATSSASTNEWTFATNVTQFKAFSSTLAYWTDTSGNLWYGNGTSAPTFVDSNVADFKTDDGWEVYVLDKNNTLWRELGTAATSKAQVDENVAAFQPYEFTYVYVKGTDSKLWLENGTYLDRQFIDADVNSFQAIDGNNVYVLGSNQYLWHEVGPWGNGTQGYTSRGNNPLDVGVYRFDVVPGAFVPAIYVLDDNKDLWNETEDGVHTPGSYRYWVDGNVIRFSPVDSHTVYVQGSDTKLWQEASDMTVRQFTDSGLNEFQAMSDQLVFVLWNGSLLYENMPPAPVSFEMPSGGLLDSKSAVWIQPSGAFTFTSYVQAQDYWPVSDDFSVAWTVEDTNDNVYTFDHSGTLQGCPPPGLGNCPSDTFSKPGKVSFGQGGYAALKAGYKPKWDVEKTTDWAGVLKNLEEAYSVIKKIITVFEG